jgi:hypothetical protein
MIHRNGPANRNFLYEFTPVADGNWQTITYTVPGDTSGTWDKTNSTGWRWELCIGNGTAFHASTVGSWFSGTYYHSTPNQVNFLDSTSNELGITGVQVEVGSKATPFEHRSYGDELSRCQRYYQEVNVPSNSYLAQYSNNGHFYGSPIAFITETRTQPSSITYQTVSGSNYWVEVGITAFSAASTTNITFSLSGTTSTAMVQSRNPGGASPSRNFTYIWEPRFLVKINAEL